MMDRYMTVATKPQRNWHIDTFRYKRLLICDGMETLGAGMDRLVGRSGQCLHGD